MEPVFPSLDQHDLSQKGFELEDVPCVNNNVEGNRKPGFS